MEAGKEVNPTLLRGHIPDLTQRRPAPDAKPEEQKPRTPQEAQAHPFPTTATPPQAMPMWYWLAADLLLVALALLLVFKRPGPLTPLRGCIAVGSVVLGGGLALWALRQSAEK